MLEKAGSETVIAKDRATGKSQGGGQVKNAGKGRRQATYKQQVDN
jgi:hypothetical protein